MRSNTFLWQNLERNEKKLTTTLNGKIVGSTIWKKVMRRELEIIAVSSLVSWRLISKQEKIEEKTFEENFENRSYTTFKYTYV